MKNGIIFTSVLVLKKNPDYIEYCLKQDISIFLIENHGTVVDKILKSPFSSYFTEIVFTSNEKKLIKKILSWNKKYKIVGLVNLRDNFTVAASTICQILELRNPGVFASSVCSNKILQRKLLKKYSPGFTILNGKEKYNESNFNLPYVLKPHNGSSSKDVFLIETLEILETLADQLKSSDQKWLLEEYICGDEYSVESLIDNEQIIFSGITQKSTNEKDGKYFVEMGHTVPDFSLSSEKRNELLEIHSQILDRLDFQYGIAHAEYKIDSNGKIYLIEIACRPPGDGIVDLYSRSVKESFPEKIMELLISQGEEKSKNFTEVTFSLYSKQQYFYHSYGKLKEIESTIDQVWFYEDNQNEFQKYKKYKYDVPYLYVYRNAGDTLSEIKSSYDRCCAIIHSADTTKQLEEEIADFIEEICISFD